MVVGFTLPAQLVSITSKVVSSNPAHGEVYSKRIYVIIVVSDLLPIGGFFQVLRFPPPIKLTATIADILLKVALNTTTLTLTPIQMKENSNEIGMKTKFRVQNCLFILELLEIWFFYVTIPIHIKAIIGYFILSETKTIAISDRQYNDQKKKEKRTNN